MSRHIFGCLSFVSMNILIFLSNGWIILKTNLKNSVGDGGLFSSGSG